MKNENGDVGLRVRGLASLLRSASHNGTDSPVIDRNALYFVVGELDELADILDQPQPKSPAA